MGSRTATFSLESETLDALKKYAHDTGQKQSVVVNAAIRAAIATPGQPATQAPPKPYSRKERAILDAYARLKEKNTDEAGQLYTRFYTLREFVRESGLYPSEARQGLKALESRGEMEWAEFQHKRELERYVALPEDDRWKTSEPMKQDHWAVPIRRKA
jgi:hypothetical protein